MARVYYGVKDVKDDRLVNGPTGGPEIYRARATAEARAKAMGVMNYPDKFDVAEVHIVDVEKV